MKLKKSVSMSPRFKKGDRVAGFDGEGVIERVLPPDEYRYLVRFIRRRNGKMEVIKMLRSEQELIGAFQPQVSKEGE